MPIWYAYKGGKYNGPEPAYYNLHGIEWKEKNKKNQPTNKYQN